MITATPGVITAGAASAVLVALAARRLHTSGGGYGLLAAIAAGALTSPGLLTRLPTRACRPIVVFTASGRRGLADLVLAGITALAALVCYRAGTSTGNVAFAAIILSHVPDGTRGRVFSRSGLIWPPMRLASLLLDGPLAGIRAAYYLGGTLQAAAARAGLILRCPGSRGGHDWVPRASLPAAPSWPSCADAR